MKQILVDKCNHCPKYLICLRVFPGALNDDSIFPNCPLPDASEPLKWSDELPEKAGRHLCRRWPLPEGEMIYPIEIFFFSETDVTDSEFMERIGIIYPATYQWYGPLPE
ncbi:MAG: hypothetical protein HQK55_07955 [Deltaproteobacteria bacterium]|nr:hypothetical protein [Deltaproteobacteria bacterium]